MSNIDILIWNECFDKIENDILSHPIHYRDSENLEYPIFLNELYLKSNIDVTDGISYLIDVIAYLFN